MVMCTCQQCNKQYKVDVVIPDDLWEKIKPNNKPKGAGLLCGICIINNLEELGYYALYFHSNSKQKEIDPLKYNIMF